MLDTMTEEATITRAEIKAILSALFDEACKSPRYRHKDQNYAYIDALLDVELKIEEYIGIEN